MALQVHAQRARAEVESVQTAEGADDVSEIEVEDLEMEEASIISHSACCSMTQGMTVTQLLRLL